LADGAAPSHEAHVRDQTRGKLHVDGELVPAQRVGTVHLDVGAVEGALVPRMGVMVEDHFTIQIIKCHVSPQSSQSSQSSQSTPPFAARQNAPGGRLSRLGRPGRLGRLIVARAPAGARTASAPREANAPGHRFHYHYCLYTCWT